MNMVGWFVIVFFFRYVVCWSVDFGVMWVLVGEFLIRWMFFCWLVMVCG